jgi:dTDP-D-glucose 4,6-dehydratase
VKDRHDLRYAIDASKINTELGFPVTFEERENRNLVFRKSNLVE